MDDLFKAPGFVLRNDENPMWELDAGDFPITIYDRPQLAFSNLLLRGDVDAATRAIFSPQSLTPAEMKTISGHFLQGKNKNPITKTLVDISTNPIFIIGALLALKVPLGKADVLFKIGRGMADKAPFAIESLTHSAFENLRNVKGAFKALAEWGKATGNFLHKHSESLSNAFGFRLTNDQQLMSWAYQKGLHTEGGTEAFLKVWNARARKLGMNEIKAKVLFPGLQKKMGRELVSTSQKIRNWLDSYWKEIFPDPIKEKVIRAELQTKGTHLGFWQKWYFPEHSRYSRLQSRGLANWMGSRKQYTAKLEGVVDAYVSSNLKKVSGLSIGRWEQLRRAEQLGMTPITGWLQEIVKRSGAGMEDVIRSSWASVERISDPVVQASSFTRNVLDTLKGAGSNISARLGNRIVREGALAQVAGELRSAAGSAKFDRKIAEVAGILTEPAHYDMRVIPALRRYLTTTASTYAWHIADVAHPTVPGKIVHGFSSLINPIIDKTRGWQNTYLAHELTPFMRGMKPWKSFIRSVRFGEVKDRMMTWLTIHPLPQKMLPPDTKKWLAKYYSDFSSLSSESLGAKIGEYFYLSTLGLNMSPISKNLLQNFITLMHTPGIGMTGIFRGFKELMPKVKVYADELLKGTKADAAFDIAFPDFVKASGKAANVTRALMTGDRMKEGLTAVGRAGTTWETVKKIMLSPFGGSETFNRLLGFYSGKQGYLATATLKGLTEKQVAANALEFGANMMHVGHFAGGPLGMPRALLGMWGPARQFMHFPLRYLGFLTSSLRWGEGAGRLTTIGRTAAASTAAYIGAKNLLGADISQGLMYGALPFPTYENAPFYPFPLVPPIASIAGSAVKSLATGEAEHIKRSAAMLIPSGLALRRLYKTLGPKNADYENRLPDGRIPVYNDKHALIGAYSPWQLALRAMGLSPSSQQAEYGAAKWLLSQREKVRAYRREYLEALSENDVDKAGRINEKFQKAYPELGPLQLKKSDIKAVQNRREISRLNRILKGFPKAYQPLFGHMVSQAGLSEMTRDIESQPTALETYLPLTQTLR